MAGNEEFRRILPSILLHIRPIPELMKATYGAAKAKTLKVPGPLAMVIRGLRLAIAAKKLPYEIVSSRDEANKVTLLALRKSK